MLRTLIANLPGFVYRCKNDPDWTMEFLGGRFEEMTGYRPEELVLNRVVAFNDLIVPEHRERLWDTWQAALDAGEPARVEYAMRCKDGSLIWVWEQGRGVYDEAGELQALEGFITDITERKEAEEERRRLEAQLRRSQKLQAVGQLAAGVAHDFNNILTAILGYTDLLKELAEESLGAEHALGWPLDEIEVATQRAAALTQQLLAFSRKGVARPCAASLNDLLAGMETELRRLAGEEVELGFDLEAGLRDVSVDPGRLEQVVVNLVTNAVQAMPGGGRLTLRTALLPADEGAAEGAAPDRVQLVVEDTGQGMAAATRERIFEPFFTTRPVDQGTGLGLATVHGIVQQLGGRIEVDSEPGRGTTFRILLPTLVRTDEGDG